MVQGGGHIHGTAGDLIWKLEKPFVKGPRGKEPITFQNNVKAEGMELRVSKEQPHSGSTENGADIIYEVVVFSF